MNPSEELLVLDSPEKLQRRATDVAGLCKKIVQQTAITIAGRKYVPVEGWQAIANGFGCSGSARNVELIYADDGRLEGVRAIGEVRRNSDGALIATAEGFVGTDEIRWFGGERETVNKQTRKKEMERILPAPMSHVRAMAQTRAVGRALRLAFAYVVVIISKNLQTTPAEEIPEYEPPSKPKEKSARGRTVTPSEEPPTPSEETQARATAAPEVDDWREVVCSYGKKDGNLRGRKLGDLTDSNLRFLHDKFVNHTPAEDVEEKDKALVEALRLWKKEQE